jgi:hypothetical protein
MGSRINREVAVDRAGHRQLDGEVAARKGQAQTHPAAEPDLIISRTS